MTLPHGAKIYDYESQNICMADCLTIQPEGVTTGRLLDEKVDRRHNQLSSQHGRANPAGTPSPAALPRTGDTNALRQLPAGTHQLRIAGVGTVHSGMLRDRVRLLQGLANSAPIGVWLTVRTDRP